MTDNNPTILDIEDVCISYGGELAVRNVSLPIYEKKITAIIGPSGCGKSTLLRSLNRMNDFIHGCEQSGKISFQDTDLYASTTDPVEVRLRIGMVFQRPNPFPKSIYRNIAWGPSINGFGGNMDERVEKALRQAALWDEVKDRLQDSALNLSGGQQQRLCIARAIAVDPEVILMDEPCSALDPIATARIEELISELRNRYAIAIVTHNMQQAARVSQRTAFFHLGELVEYGPTEGIFTNPQESRTSDYITGRYG